jgi:hypothetical protein
MFPVPLHARIAQLCKIPQGIFHIPLSPIYIPVAYSNLYASALGLQVFLGRGEPYLPSKGPQMCDAQQLKHLDGSFRHSPVPSDLPGCLACLGQCLAVRYPNLNLPQQVHDLLCCMLIPSRHR